MKVSKNLLKAITMCAKAHEGHFDKSGVPYIYHPLKVAQNAIELGFDDEKTVITALLHDVAEDTDITIEELTSEFGEEVGAALSLLNHDKYVPYMDYVKAVKHNDIAKAVKMADLTHNMDLSRLKEVTDKDLERVKKYNEAYKLLEI